MIVIAFILPGMEGIEVVRFGVNVDVCEGQGVGYGVGSSDGGGAVRWGRPVHRRGGGPRRQR